MYPARAGKQWTVREIRSLKLMLKNGTSYPRMCESLQRSITAIYERAKLIRYAEFITAASNPGTIKNKDMVLSQYSSPIKRPDK